MYDYHLHTSFSGDSDEDMEAIIIRAIKEKGKELCFTDHLDYDYPTIDISFDFNDEAFTEHFNQLKNKYKDQIILRKGIELGLQPHLAKECSAFVKHFKPDFVLCSFHVVEKNDLYVGEFFNDKTPTEAWKKYYKDVYDTLSLFKDYSVVGHLDLPKRYSEGAATDPIEHYKDELIKVLKLIIKDDKGIEVNMSGLRLGKPSLPGRDIIELYYELGGKYITLGSDAHRKEDIYSHVEEVLEMLSEIGFTSFTTFESLKPIQHDIKTALD